MRKQILFLIVGMIALLLVGFVSANPLTFSTGDKVKVINTLTAGLKVRPTAGALTYTAIEYDGTIGTIMSDSPKYAYLNGVNYYWHRIDWGGGITGWSADGYPGGVDYLVKLSDLTVTSVLAGAGTEFKPGDYIVVSWTVNNQGGLSSGSFYNRVSLGVNPYGTGILLGNYPMNSISSGSSSSDAQVPQIPSDVAPGYYYVTVFADGYQSITELSEDNNINKATSQIHISASCTNECTTSGATTCSGNYRQTCGNYDADSCLEWGGDSYCSYGCSSGSCLSNQVPTCSLSSSPRSGNAPLTVTFNLGASDSDGSIGAWVLDINGDGTADYSGTGNPPSTKTHAYTTAGSYSVVFLVSDNYGATSNPCLDTINVGSNNPPTASLSASPLSGDAPLTVGFNLSASDSDGNIARWNLSYGDGIFDSGTGNPPATKTHLYSSEGTYSAVLVVYDNGNIDAFSMKTITVNPSAPQSTLTLYVHEGSVYGNVIPGARINGVDASGNSFDMTANSEGYVSITGASGTWSFTASKSGYQTVSWSQLINVTSRKDAFIQKEESPVSIILTSPLTITPVKSQYDVSNILSAQFKIKNTGTSAVTLDVLTVGGRDPDNAVFDFSFNRNVTINAGSEYTYTGNILSLLSKQGNYHFFCTYKTQDGRWNTNIDLGTGLTVSDREKDLSVVLKYYLSSVPLVDRGGIIIPQETFPEGKGKMIPIYTPEVIDGSNIIRNEDGWTTVKEVIPIANFDFDELNFFLGLFKVNSAESVREAVANSYITLITSAIDSSSVIKYKTTIQQKGSEENFRAIIQQGVYPSTLRDLAGSTDKILFGTGWVPYPEYLFYSSCIKQLFHLEMPPFPYNYLVTLSVDSLHHDDEYLYYLSVANNGRIMITPKTYPNDNVKVKIVSDFNPFDQETVVGLSGENYTLFFSGGISDEASNTVRKSLFPIKLVSNSTITIQEHSSGELRAYDSNGNVTGVVNGEVKEEIPFSMYDNETKTVFLSDSSSTYRYDLVGTTTGTYGLTMTSIGKESANTFEVVGIPVSDNSVHSYQVNWNNFSQAGQGLTMKVDSNGDGTFEQSISAGICQYLDGNVAGTVNNYAAGTSCGNGKKCDGGGNCITPLPLCNPSDFNMDGAVDASDYITLKMNFGFSAVSKSQGDSNGDGIVDWGDLQIFMVNAGTFTGACVESACFKDSDCGASSWQGDLFCSGKNVTRNYLTFMCNSPGTSSAYCTNSTPVLINETCSDACINGKCEEITCINDTECDDGNVLTEDKCLNPGTVQSQCTHNPIACFSNLDCGNSGFIGNTFCQSGNVSQDYMAYTCNSPGTSSAYCTNSTSVLINQTCADGCSNGQCVTLEIINTGWKSPSSNKGIDGFGVEHSWANPANAYLSDNFYATALQGDQKLYSWYNFGLSIPAGATIKGIEVSVEAKADSTAICGDNTKISLRLTKNKNDGVGGTGLTPTLTSSDVVYTLGSPTDLWWTNWSPSDFGTDFGVSFVNGWCASNPTTLYSIDQIRIKVYYTLPLQGISGAGSDMLTQTTVQNETIKAENLTEPLVQNETSKSNLIQNTTEISLVKNQTTEKVKQKDSDKDGVNDKIDLCLDTKKGEKVDKNGCSAEQFCGSINVVSKKGDECVNADWNANEGKKKNPQDCAVKTVKKTKEKYCTSKSTTN